MLMFQDKQWLLGGLKKQTHKIDNTGTVDSRSAPGSGCTLNAHVADKMYTVDDLILSQDNATNTHRTQRQIARQTGFSLTSVRRIIKSEASEMPLKKNVACTS